MVSDSGDQIADPGPHQHTDTGAQGADTGPNNEQYSFIRVLKLLSWISTNHIPYTMYHTHNSGYSWNPAHISHYETRKYICHCTKTHQLVLVLVLVYLQYALLVRSKPR
jgi:hypothetical protein